jgi:DNA polymerase-3 subunit delta'
MQHQWPVYGHDWAVDYLRKGMLNKRVRHAYLITGAPNVGKNTLAHAFTMALNCQEPDINGRPCGVCRDCKKILSGNHSDILYAESDGGTLKIEAVRAITSRIAMKPYEGRYRVAIFPDFDRAQPRTQDALLKTLEEPPPHAVLILLASSLETVLSTITSRSQVIQLRPVPAHQIRDILMNHYYVEEDDAALLARISGGRIGWALQAVQSPDYLAQRNVDLDLMEQIISSDRSGRFALADKLSRDKQSLAPLFELWLTYWRDILLYLEGDTGRICNIDRRPNIERLAYDVTSEAGLKAIRATQTALNQLMYNLNMRLALEVLFLNFPILAR